MRSITTTLLLLIATCPAAFLHADGPSFAPYGALRGRVKYVEGEHRTRERVRWGNGLTPTGGQVLIHGFSAASNIFGDRGDSGSLDSRGAINHAGRIEAYRRLGAENKSILTKLNATRLKLGLDELSFSDDSPIGVKSGSGSGEEGDVDFLEDFVGVAADFKAKDSVRLFPKLDGQMRGLMEAWNSLAETAGDSDINEKDHQSLKVLRAGLEQYREAMNDLHRKVFNNPIVVREMPVNWSGKGTRSLKDKQSALWTTLVESLGKAAEAHSDANDYTKKYKLQADKLIAKGEGGLPQALKRYRTETEKLSALFSSPEVREMIK